jgi:hypothetical protein
MKSKAALFLEATKKDYDVQDYIPDAVKWWSKLAPEMQKKWLAKLSPEAVASIYDDLYGPPKKIDMQKHEAMNDKLKKVLKAAVIAAFLASGSAHAADYTPPSHTPTKAQQEYSREMGGGGGGQVSQKQSNQQNSGPSLTGVYNVTAQALSRYGNAHTQQRTSKTTADVDFIVGALKVLTGK